MSFSFSYSIQIKTYKTLQNLDKKKNFKKVTFFENNKTA